MIKTNKLQKNKNDERGFTLVETLVAITILLIAIVGPLQIASRGLFAAFHARDEITASYLAQEAVELVRNVRDETFLTNAYSGSTPDTYEWLEPFVGVCISDGDGGVDDKKCYMSPTTGVDGIEVCDDGPDKNCPPLQFDEDSGIYSYDEGSNSKFTREITIIPTVNNEEAIIEVTIKWTTGLVSNRSITIRENIMNWQNK